MSIEDRDWYKEEYKKKQGRAGSSEWLKKENKPQRNNKTINEFLAGERESDKKVRDARYNPKEFRIDRLSSKRPWVSKEFVNSCGTTKSSNTNTKKYQGVNKREKIRTVRFTPKISAAKASLICIFFMFLTFSATMLIFATKPTLLNVPYQIALKIINVL